MSLNHLVGICVYLNRRNHCSVFMNPNNNISKDFIIERYPILNIYIHSYENYIKLDYVK